jgi:hypothetical protein
MDPQVDKIMLARKKNSPLMSKWATLKGKYKVLSSRNVMKSDPEPGLKAYDDAAQKYSDALDDKKKLVEILGAFYDGMNKIDQQISKLKADRDKSDDEMDWQKNATKLNSYKGKADANPTDVTKALADYSNSLDKALALHKNVMDQIIKTGFTMGDTAKASRDEYKTAADKLETTLQKAYDDSDKSQEAIRKAVSDCMDTADEIDNADLKKALQAFYTLANA